MSEGRVIEQTERPNTRHSLVADLRASGLMPGMTVLVHSSLSALGWVCVGQETVIQALLDVLTADGTLVMPAFSANYTDPARWQHPPVPAAWIPRIRDSMPVFDPRGTPTRGIGRVAEAFRSWPGVYRGDHPNMSFAALGPHAREITEQHALSYGLGEGSPLARLYDLEASVLLLGVGYTSATIFHLAEYRAPGATVYEEGAPVLEAGNRIWRVYPEIELDADVFTELGAAFEQEHIVRKGCAGNAETRLFAVRSAVDFGVSWLSTRRDEQAESSISPE